MARRQKISQMTPKGANLQATDLLEISELSGTGYITKSITGQQIINASGGGGGSQDLQQVTDIGATTTNPIEVTAGADDLTAISGSNIRTDNTLANTSAKLVNTGTLALKTGAEESALQNTVVTNPGVILEFPDKATGSYTIATTDDIPTVSGFVPYTGATADVNLGTFHLDAAKGTFTHNGSTDTLTANHTGGSGIGLSITKGGANEGLKVNKTSGSGNAATIIGTLEATTLVKTGGTSSQFLMADGSTLNFFRLDFTPSSVVTGTTSETQVGVIEIPPNSIKNIDNLRIYTPIVKSGTVGTCIVTYKLSNSATMPTGTTGRIGFVTATTGSLWIGMIRNASYNGGNLIITSATTSQVSDLITAAQTPSVLARDNTVTQYLYVSITLGNAGDSAYLAGGYITNM